MNGTHQTTKQTRKPHICAASLPPHFLKSIPADAIEKLRKLIQMKISQHMTYRCDTGIMLGCQSCTIFLGIHTHASEFPDTELFSPISETILKIKYRAAIIGFHRNGNDQHDG